MARPSFPGNRAPGSTRASPPRLPATLALSTALALCAPAAQADFGFALHAEGAAAHAVGDRSDQFGWGATGLVAPELLLGRKIGFELPLGLVGLSAGPHQSAAYVRVSNGGGFFATPGVRLRPLAGPAPGWGDALWIAAGGGVADTGGLLCPALDARAGVDLRAGALSLGPYLGFMEIIDVQGGPLRHDASLVALGIHAQWERRAAPPQPPVEGQDVALGDVDGPPDAEDTCPDGPADADPCPAPEPPSVVVERSQLFQDFAERILFTYDSAVIQPGGTSALKRIAESIQEHQDYRLIDIRGHADDRGDDTYNMHLSEARARAVRAALVELGADGRRLQVEYFGNHDPRSPGRSDEARRQNRRVEFNLVRVRMETVPAKEARTTITPEARR
jgi:outer membrane protein OmpA-like peptidoglycan-associated protein